MSSKPAPKYTEQQRARGIVAYANTVTDTAIRRESPRKPEHHKEYVKVRCEMPYASRPCSVCGGSGAVLGISGIGIRAIREQTGRTLRQMAREIGISPAYLSDMELGRRQMSEETARRIIQLCAEGDSR